MYNILVCDDEKDIVSALSIYLKSDGYQVYKAYNGKEALELVQKEDMHLVLMDIMMPLMDGLTAASNIRRLDRPDAVQVPIIAMTANAFDSDRRKSKAAGMDEHISKPIDVDQLFEVLARLLPDNAEQAKENHSI